MHLDYDTHEFWGSWQVGSTFLESTRYSFIGTPQITSLTVGEDFRSGSRGIDIDWITISNGVPNSIPEPATLALMGLGLAGIGFRRKGTA